MVDYELTSDPKLQLRLRNRFRQELAALGRLHFALFGYSLESEGPYSAIVQSPMLLLMLLNREILVFPRPLRLGVGTILLHRSNPPSIALCMGKGVKLYTAFEDRTLLITSTFRSYAVPVPTSRIIKPAPLHSIDAAWQSHQENVERLAGEGRAIRSIETHEGYVELCRQEEDLSQYE